MDTSEVESLVEDLGGNIDDLEEALQPILRAALSATASKLPLLDKAKLYVLATYAIESILFSALRLNGTDAKSHPVFQELSRVKEYFGKIKTAETAGQKRSTVVDKEAAGRFIKHGLAGNEKYDRERAERQAREKVGAKRKLEEMSTGTHTRFDGAAKRIRASDQGVAVVQASGLEEDEAGEAETSSSAPEPTSSDQQIADQRAAKRQRRLERRLAEQSAEGGDSGGADGSGKAKASPRASKSHGEGGEAQEEGISPQAEGKKSKKKRRKNRSQMAQEMEDKRADEMK